jgi:hypothetical protein
VAKVGALPRKNADLTELADRWQVKASGKPDHH